MLKEKLNELLKDLGIPASLKGYKYIIRAVEMSIEDPECLYGITKRLYPEIAKEFDTKASRVERCIRNAVEVGCSRCDVEKMAQLFRKSYSPAKGKPTNKEFIATLAEAVNSL